MHVACVFTLDELWYLQSIIRHGQEREWNCPPPTSMGLNDEIAHAIVWCELMKQGDVALLLDRAACLAIDYCAKQGDKDAKGQLIGKTVIRKVCYVRAELAGLPSSREEFEDQASLPTRIDEWRVRLTPGTNSSVEQGEDHASTSTGTDRSTDDQSGPVPVA